MAVDTEARTISVSGKKNKTLSVAVENARLANQLDYLAQSVNEAIDTLDAGIEDIMDSFLNGANNMSDQQERPEDEYSQTDPDEQEQDEDDHSKNRN